MNCPYAPKGADTKNCPQPWHREKRIVDGVEEEYCICPFCAQAECWRDRPITERFCCIKCRKLIRRGEGRYCSPEGSICLRCNFQMGGLYK